MADETLEEVSTLDISKLKVPDLKKELKNRGLTTTGNKNELIERLQTALKSSDTATADSMDDIEEDLLNDDDDEHIDEREESIINDLDNDLDDIPKAQKRKSDTEGKPEVASGPPKKVILKRNTTETLAAMAKASKPEEKSEEEKKSEDKKSSEPEEKKVIKLSELSAKERLEMRAKKFGVTALGDDAKKLARAERFGITATSTTNSLGSIKSEGNASIDVLKQRAARFGVSVSSVMSDIEKKEKLEKRKERFGAAAATNNGKTDSDLDALKAARLERFKKTVN